MTSISVITIIFRYGYIDTLVQSLRNQSFKEFEFVLVDELYWLRRDMVKDYIGNSFPLKHIPPREVSKVTMSAHAHNDGIMHSEGELLYYLSDYVYLHPDCLKRHWEIYQKYGPKVIISGPLIYFYPFLSDNSSKLKLAVNYQGSVVKFKDYADLAIKENLLSVLENKFEPEWPSSLMPDPRIRNVCNMPLELYLWECTEHYLLSLDPSCHKFHWWAGVNDSAPLEAMLDLNGFNENLDGEYGGHIDGDISARLMSSGYRFLIDTKVPAMVLPKTSLRAKGEKIEGKNVPMQTYSLRETRESLIKK